MGMEDGGPFHPCEVEHIDGEVYGIQTGVSRSIHTGASLRDHFAGLAMQAHIGLGIYAEGLLMPHEVAAHAYEMADQMLAAREGAR
jgi:hypothetical protein